MPFPPLHLALPVIGAPMFRLSGPELVVAQCTAGIIGAFPALNARPPETLDTWLTRITHALAAHTEAHPHRPAAPFAVNQIVHRSNARLQADVETCVRHRVPIVITSLGARPEVNDAIHSYGGLVLHDVISNAFARKAIEKGADGLVAVAAGAGGHAGTTSPFALLAEIRAWFGGPVALSGAIATGAGILAAQAAGADLAYIGTPFIATPEARAEPAYREAILAASAADIVYTDHFTGVHGNYLRASIEAAGLDPAALPGPGQPMDVGAGTARAWKDIWGAGQGLGAITDIVPAAERIARWSREYQDAAARLAALLPRPE